MIVLGIGDSHEAHACLVVDGKLVAAIAEERLSRLKADMGYPQRSIGAVLQIAGITASQVDIVAFAGTSGHLFQGLYKGNATMSVKDYVRQCHDYWKPVLLDGKVSDPFHDFEMFRHLVPNIEDDPYFTFVDQARGKPMEEWHSIARKIRRQTVVDHLGISPDKVFFYRHEDCHKVYGYHSAPFKQSPKTLVLTCEGGGDDSSATVSTTSDGSTFSETWRSNEVMLGRLYRYVTLILGMKPNQHEYKVMGLAPFGNLYHGCRSLDLFRQVNEISGSEIIHPDQIKDMYFSIRDALEGERFDGIAWALQTYIEEILCSWITENIKTHNTPNIIFSGGVAQNIKACKAILERDEVESLWVGPISGDGSLGIGAAWMASLEHAPDDILDGMPNIYLGTSYASADIQGSIEATGTSNRYEVKPHVTPQTIAKWLDAGKIVARYSGRMEFGQRALGNRSILADPRNASSVERINAKIKYRDFWMPFTPSMLASEGERLLENPKKMPSPFMTMAFDVRPEFHDQLPAVIHPADKTARPQLLERAANPKYYDLISAFKDITGLGVVLNTSFNLHGEAIVESPADAISTFDRSDLDVLLLEDMAICRNS